MKRTDWSYQNCVRILSQELVPATGCTEPIAIAYAAALARDTLGCIPEQIKISCSGNIIKNVKSVIVPGTGNLRGIPAAAGAGIIAGSARRKLELLNGITSSERLRLQEYLSRAVFCVEVLESPHVFDLTIIVAAGGQTACVRLTGHHTNVVLIQKNDRILFCKEADSDPASGSAEPEALTVEGILDFADSVELADVEEILSRQIAYNTAISEEGLAGNYGAGIGRILTERDSTLRTKLAAAAAAGSDARMSGCEMPVIINSGSGNQGIAVSVPVVVFAQETGVCRERLLRALALANLLAIHQRHGIGRLSAYCGAINAGIAAVCGIAYLRGESAQGISCILINGLAIASGVICDGAKASCASKIAVGIDAGLLGYDMHRNHQCFRSGDGIVKEDAESTIGAVARLGRFGMRETDREILKIMTGQ